jgi:hypothetical protein
MRPQKGSSIIELPVLLFVAFVILGFPLAGLATLTYRAALFHAIVRNACVEAARARSFTSAQNVARASLSSGCSMFTDLGLGQCKVSIVTKDVSTNAESESFRPLAKDSIAPDKNLYFIKVDVNGSIAPVIETRTAPGGLSSPGYTEPYNLSASMKLFAERPMGLAY